MFRRIIFMISITTVFCCTRDPTVFTSEGLVKGLCVPNGNKYFYSFTSIPYAKPPVGNLRFEPPQSISNWSNILDATRSHELCPQIDFFNTMKFMGNEDCLYLNVYTPQLYKDSDLPVMIYFHGGALQIGSANFFNPKAFLKENVVLVLPSYRLGALGFLSTGDTLVPGNNGLKDQTFSIQWTKRNIRHFGGNPNDITVFGESAGASSAHYHMLSPLSKDLISAVISQSGVSTSVWSFDHDNKVPDNSRNLSKLLHCPTENSFDMVGCLKRVSARDIVLNQRNFPGWFIERMTPFRPVLEPDLPGSFLSKHPYDIIKLNEASKVPFMTGVTTEDGAMLSPRAYKDNESLLEFNKNFNVIVPNQLDYINNPYKDYMTKSIKTFYYDKKQITDSDKSRTNLTNMYTDRMFLYSQNKVIRLHLKHTNHSVYSYVFGFKGSSSFSAIYGDPKHNYGTAHGDDLLYLSPMFPLNEEETLVSELLVKLWVNFATYKNPNPKCLLGSSCWTPVQSNNIEYFFIKNFNQTKMSKKLHKERMQFWKNMPVEIFL